MSRTPKSPYSFRKAPKGTAEGQVLAKPAAGQVKNTTPPKGMPKRRPGFDYPTD